MSYKSLRGELYCNGGGVHVGERDYHVLCSWTARLREDVYLTNVAGILRADEVHHLALATDIDPDIRDVGIFWEAFHPKR